MGFHPEHLSAVIPGKRGRVQNNAVKGSPLPGEPFQPAARVPLAKVLAGGVNAVQNKIFPGPVQARLRQIQRGCLRSPQGGVNGKGPRIGKGIQHPHARSAFFPHPAAVVALVQKNSLGITGGHVYFETHSLLQGRKLQGKERPGDLDGRFFLVLFQFFVEYGQARIPEFAFQVRRNGTSARGDENTIRHLIHKDTGNSIPCPVHDPEHIRIRRNQFPVAFHAMMIISLYGRAKSNG